MLEAALSIVLTTADGSQRQEMTMTEKLLAKYKSEPEAAKELRQTTRTLRSWRQRGIGPAFVKIGRSVYYPHDGMAVWLKAIETKPVRSRRAA